VSLGADFLPGARREPYQHRFGFSLPDTSDQGPDRAALHVAMSLFEPHHGIGEPLRRPDAGFGKRLIGQGLYVLTHLDAHAARHWEVREHRPGFDGAQLVFVAEQDQASVVGQRLDELGGKSEVQHRGLVYDHQIIGQGVLAVMAERDPARPVAEQPVHGVGLGRQPRFDLRGHRQPGQLVAQGSLQARGRLAGRGRERHA
jgi:hypothetical protein